MTNNPTARAPNPYRLTPPGVLASIPTRQDLTDLLIRCQPSRALRSADAHLLEVPRCRLHTNFKYCSTPLEQSAARCPCHRLPRFVQKATEDITI